MRDSTVVDIKRGTTFRFFSDDFKSFLAFVKLYYERKIGFSGSTLLSTTVELDRRIGDPKTLDKELAAWQQQRDLEQAQLVWRFTTDDARIKLRRLYPNPAN